MRIDDNGRSATFMANAQDNLSLSSQYAITPPVQISCANIKVLALVDIPRIRRHQHNVLEHSAMNQLPTSPFPGTRIRGIALHRMDRSTGLRPGRFTHAHSSARKDGCYGTRTFAAWNGGTPFKYNARIEAAWLDVALSWLMSVIPSKAVALGYV